MVTVAPRYSTGTVSSEFTPPPATPVEKTSPRRSCPFSWRWILLKKQISHVMQCTVKRNTMTLQRMNTPATNVFKTNVEVCPRCSRSVRVNGELVTMTNRCPVFHPTQTRISRTRIFGRPLLAGGAARILRPRIRRSDWSFPRRPSSLPRISRYRPRISRLRCQENNLARDPRRSPQGVPGSRGLRVALKRPKDP